MKLSGQAFPEAKSAVERIVGRVGLPTKNPSRPETKAHIVATYDYTDEKGRLLYQQVRHEPKDFRLRRPDGRSGWIWNMQGVRRVPYRLPEILEPEEVYTTEGEKDADVLWRWGVPATTAGGTGKWREEHSNHLSGKRVVILFDNDDKGRKDAIRRARLLLGVASTVKIVELPGLPPKGHRGGASRHEG